MEFTTYGKDGNDKTVISLNEDGSIKYLFTYNKDGDLLYLEPKNIKYNGSGEIGEICKGEDDKTIKSINLKA